MTETPHQTGVVDLPDGIFVALYRLFLLFFRHRLRDFQSLLYGHGTKSVRAVPAHLSAPELPRGLLPPVVLKSEINLFPMFDVGCRHEVSKIGLFPLPYPACADRCSGYGSMRARPDSASICFCRSRGASVRTTLASRPDMRLQQVPAMRRPIGFAPPPHEREPGARHPSVQYRR